MAKPLTRREHEAKARENRAFLDFLGDKIEIYPQWAATVAFYTALHTVDQLLVVLGQPTGNHERRDHTLQTLHARTLWPCYDPLSTAAHSARYRSPRDFSRTYTPDTIRTSFIGNYLAVIEREVAAQLKAIDETDS